MKKKIVIDGRMWGAGFTGIGNYIREIAPRLFTILPDYEFVVFSSAETQTELARFPNVSVKIASQKIYSIGEQTSFWWQIRKEKADLYWFPHFNVPLLFGRPFVVTIHDLTILRFPGKKMRRSWHRSGYRHVLNHALSKAEKIIAISEFTKSEILAFTPQCEKEKISVIHNGVDLERFAKVKQYQVAEWRKRFVAPIFLVSGVWREHKNIPNAIRAFDMYRKYGGKGSLVITGKPDPYYPEVEQLARQSRYADDIHLLGFVPDAEIPPLTQAANALIFPSLAEGFGLPALEAMAAGTPVTASNSSSLPEVCGEAALFFDPQNAEDIALKMVDICESSVRKNLIIKGKKHVQNFSWDLTAAQTASILTRALQTDEKN